MRVDFCVPVYNEEAIFNANAERIWQFLAGSQHDYEWNLVFIVNGSSRSFEKQVQTFTDNAHPETVCYIISEGGKGRAIKSYFNISQADILVYMDIDLAVSLVSLPDLINPIIHDEADLVFGSRMLPGSFKSRSAARELSSRAYLVFSRLLLKHQFSDLQCGFKAIRRSAWQKLSPLIRNNAWFFDTELIYYAQQQKMRLKEIPIDWSENRYSHRHSKVNLLVDGWKFIVETIALRRRG